MPGYKAVMVKRDTWVEIAETILNLDLENLDTNKIAYVQGLVRAEVGETVVKEEA